jgi:hypothetical protein
VADRIQLRRDTAANWLSVNPVLTQGEPGVETDTSKLKFGNGSAAWSALPYSSGGGGSAPGVFVVDDYPNTGDATNDAIGFRAAVADCIAAGGGVVQFGNKAGGYLLKTAETTPYCIVNHESRTFPFTIRGLGVNATTLKLVSPVSSLIGILPLVDDALIYPINLYDFTVDMATAANTKPGMIHDYTILAGEHPFSTTGRHHVERVNLINGGHTNSPQRFCILWNLRRNGLTAAQAAQTAHLRGLRVKDCDFGTGGNVASGTQRGAGQGGVAVISFVSGTVTDGSKDSAGLWKPSRLYGQVENAANVVVEDIIIEDMDHTSGRSSVDGSAPGAPIQLGGDGIVRQARIKGGRLRNSGDVGIECDGCQDVVIEGVEIYNSDGHGILLIPYGDGKGTEKWSAVVRDCQMIYQAVDEYGTPNPVGGTPSGGAFCTQSRFGCMMDGNVLFENILVRYECSTSTATTLIQVGPARKTVLRNINVQFSGTVDVNGTYNPFLFIGAGRPQTLIVENFRSDFQADTPTVASTHNWFDIRCANDLRVQINGIGGSSQGVETGAFRRANRVLALGCGAADASETFAVDRLDADFIFESGAATNYTWDGTGPKTYTAALNLSTEQRGLFIANATSSLAADNLIGRVMDGSNSMLMVTGATRDLYKGGAIGKRRSASDYLEAYVYDDGATSYLCLDKVVGGTRTSLLPAAGGTATGAVTGGNVVTDTITTPSAYTSNVGLALPARIGTAATHYPAIVVQGDTVTAELWQSAAPGALSTRPGDAWASATLTTAADIRLLGSRSVGEFGFTQVPVNSSAKLGTAKHRRLHVISGKIDNVRIGDLRGATGEATGLYFQPTFATKVRVGGILEIGSSDWQGLNSSGGTVFDRNFIASPTTFTQKLRMRNNTWAAATADLAVTFVSGTAWQNQTGRWGNLYIQGGTVTKIEVSKDGVTYRDTGQTAGAYNVPPEWYVKVTHSVAPTALFAHED